MITLSKEKTFLFTKKKKSVALFKFSREGGYFQHACIQV